MNSDPRQSQALPARRTDSQIIAAVQQWIQSVVVELNLCPFARRELERDAVRFSVTRVTEASQLLVKLGEHLQRLRADSRIETAFLIHPQVLQDFDDYNQFLNDCDQLLTEASLDGIFQVASFHPRYQFAGTHIHDPENYSNRSPYPMLHILRESSVARAVASHPDVEGIPHRNVDALNALGSAHLGALLRDCHDG